MLLVGAFALFLGGRWMGQRAAIQATPFSSINIAEGVQTTLASPVLTDTPTPSLTPSSTPSPTDTLTPAPTFTHTPTPTPTPAITHTPTGTSAPTDTPVPSPTQTPKLSETWGEPTGLIVFTCYDGTYDQICTVRPDGSERRQLTETSQHNYFPSLSPDGSQIVFTSKRDGEHKLWLMNVDGSNQRQIGPSDGLHYGGVFSPDGLTIAFSYYSVNSPLNIALISPNGSDFRLITDFDNETVDPVWSSDGSQIAFASMIPNTNLEFEHYIMDADGNNIKKIPIDVEKQGGRSSLSPDGKWLAFYAGDKNSRQIWLVEIATGQLETLTNESSNLAPTFTNSGDWIIFSSRRGDGDSANIYLIRPDGSEIRQVTNNSNTDWQPRWGP